MRGDGTPSPSSRVRERPTPGLAEFVRTVRSRAALPEALYTPLIFRLIQGELEDLEAICHEHGVALLDTLHHQLAELFLVRHPASEVACSDFTEQIVSGGGGADGVGSWVYFPWESKVVHILDREDYFDVITSRNQDKITRAEQELLRTKRVGVIGLSVGGEIAVTIAQEHLCGTIVLADFDPLELSNLNRLNAGIDDLSQNKAHLAARRIAKIDPYLKVIVYDEGVSTDSAAEFLAGLDLVIDECDDLALKHHLRELAKELGINMLYAADERGLLSVEPYEHAPDLPPFHGRFEGPQPSRDDPPSLEAYMHGLTEWLGGWDHISERSRQSVGRIGRSLCGYPQLASEPRLAAGQIGHAARRLLLGEELQPFLEHLDLGDKLVASPR